MKINLIFVQHKCAYPGQYAPNVVDAWDEYVLEDNEQGYQESLAKHVALVGKEYDAVKELIVHVPESAIDRLFKIPEVDASIG